MRLLRRIVAKCQMYWNRRFRRRNHVYRHCGPWPEVTRTDCAFARYDVSLEIPAHLRDSARQDGGERRVEMDRFELERHAVLWVALIEGRLASSLFTREGRHFQKWFVPLDPGDLVVFRMRTEEEFRGRGLAPALMTHALGHAVPVGACAYIDCRVYNKPSIRCIEKSGFEHIATCKPISNEQALPEA